MDEELTKEPVRKKGARPDLGTFAGLAVALLGIIGGLLIEGGRLKDIGQFTAALIVLGGTVGAVLVSTPIAVVKGALGRFKGVLFHRTQDLESLLDEMILYATKARKQGLVSLEEEALNIEDPFLNKALNLAVDGADIQDIRKMLELDIDLTQHRAEAEAKVFEAAGGFSPTIGIIGAVLGLIQVMKNLANIDEVGRGIAVSFVATVYGVGAANLFFLPTATKIKARAHDETQRRELILEGICAIVEGLNPKLIRLKLEAYAPARAAGKSKESPSAEQEASPAKAEA